MNFHRLPALCMALAFAAARAGEAPASPPEWLKLAPTNGFALVKAAVDAPISSDRTYKITVLPAELEGSWMLQRPILLFRHNVTNRLEVAQPARVYAAILYSYVGKEEFTDDHFGELEQQGWKFVENEFRTTTFQSEHWDWQVMFRDVPPGPVTFRTHNAMTSLFLQPVPGKP